MPIREAHWEQAQRLAAANRMEDALAAVQASMIEHPEYWEIQASALCEGQALAWHAQGQIAEAKRWGQRAVDLLFQYGSNASSGCEGSAARAQIDELMQRLKGVV